VDRTLKLRRKSVATYAASVDHLVSQHLHRGRHLNAKLLGSLHVDDQLEFGLLHDRKIGRLLAPENPAGKDSASAVQADAAARAAR
jgi:hypothetical protein